MFTYLGAGWPSGLGTGARGLTGDRTVNGSSPAAVKTFRFGTLAIPFTPPCQCLSDETLKAVGPFYLVPMPGEVKDRNSSGKKNSLPAKPRPRAHARKS